MAAEALGQLFDPTSARHRPNPHPLLHQMRSQAPVYCHVGERSGIRTWYLTRYHDVQQALRAEEVGRQLDRLPPELAAPHQGYLDPLAMVRNNVFNLDPPDHTRLRRLIAPAFGARTVAKIAQQVDQVVEELIDRMAGTDGQADVIRELALPLPSLVVAELVGFPSEDRGRLRWWSDEMLRGGAVRMRRAGMDFLDYLEQQLGERRADPSDDLLSRLIEAEAGGQLSHPELVSSVFQLLFAGDETTVNLIGNAVLELLRHPDQLERLRRQPELIDTAVEEAIRFNGPVGHSRELYAMTDVQMADRTIPRGDVVVPVLLAANRDPAVFADPDVLDIGRNPNHHLGFGYGIHFCLGAALARLQARAAIGTLVQRFPGLALAVEPEELEWTPSLFLHGVLRLPVRLW